MQVSTETICRVCKKFFCCAICRERHEIKQHAIECRRSQQQLEGPKLKENAEKLCGKSKMSTGDICNPIDEATDAIIYLFCPICEARPLTLHEDMYDEMVQHIASHHLPLQCLKCAKLYTHINDLRAFNKCVQLLKCCDKGPTLTQEMSTETATIPIECLNNRTCNSNVSKITVKPSPTGSIPSVTQSSISTQTSPMVVNNRNSISSAHVTPISTVVNVNWQAAIKSNKLAQEEFISDSVSSIKNISSIANSASLTQRSVAVNCNATSEIGCGQRVKGKLVRSTSTPVHAELLLPKAKEATFNDASGGHVSSIYGSGSDCDNSAKMPLVPPSHGLPPRSPHHVTDAGLCYRHKVTNRAKLAAVTPLRQVMSKSIQKAMAEHGVMSKAIIATSPLDLRLSPALRRTNNEASYCIRRRSSAFFDSIGDSLTMPSAISSTRVRREIMLSSRKLTTESIVITRMRRSSSGIGNDPKSDKTPNLDGDQIDSSSASVYQTCRSLEIITSRTEMTSESLYTTTDDVPRTRSTSLLSSQIQMIPSNSNRKISTAANTPITSIPSGSVVLNKKLINFETPQKIEETDIEIKNGATCCDAPDSATKSPAIEAYYTPNSTPSLNNNEGNCKSKERRQNAIPRNLNGHFRNERKVLHGRPTYQRRRKPETASGQPSIDLDGDVCQLPGRPRSWSFGALIDSVMSLSNMHNIAPQPTGRTTSVVGAESHNVNGLGVAASSLLKRCSSFASALVQPRPLLDENQLHSLKRKRTNPLDEQSRSNAQSPLSSGSQSSGSAGRITSPCRIRARMSTKRFRIQARKPIDRLRLGS